MNDPVFGSLESLGNNAASGSVSSSCSSSKNHRTAVREAPLPSQRASVKRQRSASSRNEAAEAAEAAEVAEAVEQKDCSDTSPDPADPSDARLGKGRARGRGRRQGQNQGRSRRRSLTGRFKKRVRTESTDSLETSDEEYGRVPRSARSPHPGVSFVAKRREYQSQITLSTKLHLGNYKSPKHAAYAVAKGKARLLALGWTVKLRDPAVDPVLNQQERKHVDERAGAAVTNFERRCLASFAAAAPEMSRSRPIAVQCASNADSCVSCGTHVFTCLSALGGTAVLLRPRLGGWEMQSPNDATWTALSVVAYCELLESHDVVTVRG